MSKGLFDLFRAKMGSESREIDWSYWKPILVQEFDKTLTSYGLKHQRSLEWTEVDSNEDGFRRVFRVHDAGALRPLSVNWGYSFDFVPHRSGNKLLWHRTFKSARRDFWVIPGPREPRAPRTKGIDHFQVALPKILTIGVERANDFWAKSHRLEDLPSLLASAACGAAELRHDENGRSRAKSEFAHPFSLARCGSRDDAQRFLERIIANNNFDEFVASDLRKKLATV